MSLTILSSSLFVLSRYPDDRNNYNETLGDILKIQQNINVGQYMQDVILDILLFQGKIKNGFFIEAGAWDFSFNSNSFWYELKYNWTGLLIEPILDQCQAG